MWSLSTPCEELQPADCTGMFGILCICVTELWNGCSNCGTRVDVLCPNEVGRVLKSLFLQRQHFPFLFFGKRLKQFWIRDIGIWHFISSLNPFLKFLCFSFSQTTDDMKPKRDQERDLELDKKIEALRRKNEALMKRYKVRTGVCRQVWTSGFHWAPQTFMFLTCRRWRRTEKRRKRREWLCRAEMEKLMISPSRSASPPVWVSTALPDINNTPTHSQYWNPTMSFFERVSIFHVFFGAGQPCGGDKAIRQWVTSCSRTAGGWVWQGRGDPHAGGWAGPDEAADGHHGWEKGETTAVLMSVFKHFSSDFLHLWVWNVFIWLYFRFVSSCFYCSCF